MSSVRLRQVVVVTGDLPGAAALVQDELGLPEPFVDPGVGEFGLENRVFAAGDDFLEVLTPLRQDTAGARYLERRGGDAGYMAIFQVDDVAAARRRVADLGIRVVWSADLGDISGTHLHPADVPGAIVSLDWADPPESWHWAGPTWRGGAPAGRAAGGVASLTVAALDPPAMAGRWADVLGLSVADDDTVEVPGLATIAHAVQTIRFVRLATGRREDEGIVEVGLRLGAVAKSFTVAGVRVDVEPVDR